MNNAFVTYETPFAPCGGIAAVMGRLPARVAAASGRSTIGITPLHHQVPRMQTVPRHNVGNVGVPFEGRTVLVNIWRHDDQIPWYFLQPEDPQFFAGTPHPYRVDGRTLLRDALFFGAATVCALPVIQPGGRWNLLLQDWESATVSLAIASHPGMHRCYLTLHNSYDVPVTPEDLWTTDINSRATWGNTVLERALSVCERQVFTVSEQFASDLIDDVLQSHVMAPHLREQLRFRIAGIDNGPFADLALPPDIYAQALGGVTAPLRAWKADYRKKFLAALDALNPQPAAGESAPHAHTSAPAGPLWGDLGQFKRDDAPWFVMAGRDDARQKGYDVAVEAARLFLERGGDGRFLFFPIPGDEDLHGLRFLKSLTEQFPQQVLAFPFLFREGFQSALRGATFGMMPSLYEPFGMSNEFYLNGTPGIGRATGGILQQIVPLRAAACFSPAVERRVARWSSPAAAPTGLLFREKDHSSATADWDGLNAGQHNSNPAGEDRVQHRRRFALFRSMAAELHRAFTDAAVISKKHPELYDRLITDGIAHITRTVSWDRAAAEYTRQLEQ